MSREGLHEPRALVAMEAPHEAQEPEVDAFGAAGRHVLPDLTPQLDGAPRCPREVQPTWQIQDDDRVGRGEPQVQAAREVAIDDPPLTRYERGHPLAPLVVWSLHPAGAPVLGVERDHRQARQRAEVASQRALACAAGTEDEQPARGGQRSGGRLAAVRVVVAHRARIDLPG